MIYLLCAIFFIFGGIIGAIVGIRISLLIYAHMAEEGILIFSADGKWEGKRDAKQSVAWQFIQEEHKNKEKLQ